MTDTLKRLPRVPFQRPVHVEKVTNEGQSTTGQRLWAVNLSSGGMFIQTSHPLAPGTIISIHLEGVAGLIPLAQGEVIWQKPEAGFGLRFLQLRPEARALVDAFIKHGGFFSHRDPLDTDITPYVGLPRSISPNGERESVSDKHDEPSN